MFLDCITTKCCANNIFIAEKEKCVVTIPKFFKKNKFYNLLTMLRLAQVIRVQ